MSFAIGLDVGGTSAKGGIVDRVGTILERTEIPTDPHAATKSLIAVAETLLTKSETLGLEVSVVGVGAAGFVDHARGSVTFSPNAIYDDRNIRAALSERVGAPVTVDNDANAAAWGERAFGVARGLDHVALVTLGTGIGSGFVVDGRLVRGASGAGAELGHTVIDPSGPRCPCGLRGCLERFASGGAIGQMGREAAAKEPATKMTELAGGIEEIRGEHVSAAAADSDEVAIEVLRKAGRALAVGLSNVVNLFDPQVIILAGSVIEAGEPYLGPARDRLHEMTTAQRRRPVRMALTSLGKDAGIVGAAALAFDELGSGGTG